MPTAVGCPRFATPKSNFRELVRAGSVIFSLEQKQNVVSPVSASTVGDIWGDAVAMQSDLLRRAEECERLMDLAINPKKKESFGLLRDMWMMLAREYPNLPGDVIAEDIAAMDVIQRVLADSESGSCF